MKEREKSRLASHLEKKIYIYIRYSYINEKLIVKMFEKSKENKLVSTI